MKTIATFFPFDLFGSSGTAAGAELLADAFREMLEDNGRERVRTRARKYTGKVGIDEFSFATLQDLQDWKTPARQALRKIFERQDRVLWITGNHLGVLPLYEELGQIPNTLVLQLDAHLDIYNLSDCTKELSHGNFLRHAEGPLPKLINVGHRELLLRPDYVRNYYQKTFSASALAVNPEPALEYIREACQQADRVILDIDCDVFDPAYFPALAHPVPFGLSPHFVLRLIDAAWSENLSGLAISEFLPARDHEDHCLATLMWLLEYILLKWYEGN